MSWAGMAAKLPGLVEPTLGDAAGPLFGALRRVEEPGTLDRVITLLARASR